VTGDAPGPQQAKPVTGTGPRRRGPVFLERATYRQRRLVDAARLLPLLGVFLWAMPLLWGTGGTATSAAILYIFAAWLGLVIGAAALALGLGRAGTALAEEQGRNQAPAVPPKPAPETGEGD
jgi:hypothetical protein